MKPPPDPDTPLPVPPACGPTTDRIHAVLDGRLAPAALRADAHAPTCPACRGRVRAAQLLCAALAEPAESVAVPAGLTNTILARVRADRRARERRTLIALTGGLVAAAAVGVAVWLGSRTADRPVPVQPQPQEIVRRAPLPPPAEGPAPAPQPFRFTDELARTGDALRDSSRALAEPAASAPKVFAALTDSLLPADDAQPPGNPEAAGNVLAEIPDAARVGLEPVTDSAQKALTRLLRDVGAIQPKSKS